MSHQKAIRLALWASGGGSNVEAIIQYFRSSPVFKPAILVTNNEHAGVLKRPCTACLEHLILKNDELNNSDYILRLLNIYRIDHIILAGYLKKIPKEVIQYFQGYILNIHPSLLPKYGGNKMYGSKVHEAVLEHNDQESGITIHHVDENYDTGRIIFQARCDISDCHNADEIAHRVQILEHEYYPRIIEQVIKSNGQL